MNSKIYNVALLSNFTIKGLAPFLEQSARRCGIDIAVYTGEYGQWQQEILGEKLYHFDPDIVYVIVDFEDMKSQLPIIDRLAGSTAAKIIICNQVSHSEVSALQNNALAQRYQNDPQVIMFDFDRWLAGLGKDQYWNTKYRELGDMRLAPAAFETFADELAAYLIPLAGKTKKCLVLDLDNTLWGKVIGEEGVGGIILHPEGEGRFFHEFQAHIKTLKERGIILAINSSNNEADVREVFSRHEHMVLREDDFASARINWNNKAQNMQEIADELNIGLDSLVFIDDDPRNRELVRSSLPEVEVIDLPADPSAYLSTLSSYKGFTVFTVTDEDKHKAQMYLDEKKRRQLRATAVDLDSFLKGLEMFMTVQTLKEEDIPRAAQLTHKTNQFNLTTRRYHEEDIAQMLESGDRIWTLEVRDKFGAYGITGLLIARDQGYWEIDTFLLSCRILGKKIEQEFFGAILDLLKQAKPQMVIGAYVPTAKNTQVKDFYEKFGFVKISSDNEKESWEYDLSRYEHRRLDIITTTIL